MPIRKNLDTSRPVLRSSRDRSRISLKCYLLIIWIAFAACRSHGPATGGPNPVISPAVMQEIHDEVKTPYKYGLVMVPEDDHHLLDSPSVFRKDGKWYMTYIVYDGRGYETWLAQSPDLLHWEPQGRIMSFKPDPDAWDNNQRAGYIALQDPEWGGSNAWTTFGGRYWMSYLGGDETGYEAGRLAIGMAYTEGDNTRPHEFLRLAKPVLKSDGPDTRWWDNETMFKSSVIRDDVGTTGHKFVMYYNAKGDSLNPASGAERIAMAVSDDMFHWKRFGTAPVIDHKTGISGDAVIQRINGHWVMFYFGAFWKPGAFNRFAVSDDLIHWTDWQGEDLIAPSEEYDAKYAHKSFVLKYDGVVYHFYCAVNQRDQRGIAVATSRDLGSSTLHFVSE